MKTFLTLLGIVFVALGLLGFISDPVLGIFAVDTMHNVVHIFSGVMALAAVGAGKDMMRLCARIFGLVYGLVGVIGFVMPGDMVLGFFEANLADDLLHVALAALLLYFGFVQKEAETDPLA